jgi:Holliday junction resolvase-like predicted endonuclease
VLCSRLLLQGPASACPEVRREAGPVTTLSRILSNEPSRAKGELDLIGYDGDTLAIVEVRTLLAVKGQPTLPEMSITRGKHEVLVRTANYFLRERHLQPCPVRFDVLAIENTPGQPPAVRLHKAALSPELPPRFN